MIEEAKPCEECGKPEGTFACKIRHINVNTENLKRDREKSGPDFGFKYGRDE